MKQRALAELSDHAVHRSCHTRAVNTVEYMGLWSVKPSRIVTTETTHCKDVGSEEAQDEREVEHLELAESECLFPDCLTAICCRRHR